MLPTDPLSIKFKEQDNDVKETTAKIFVYTSGADALKPMQMKKMTKASGRHTNGARFRRPPEVKKSDDL